MNMLLATHSSSACPTEIIFANRSMASQLIAVSSLKTTRLETSQCLPLQLFYRECDALAGCLLPLRATQINGLVQQSSLE